MKSPFVVFFWGGKGGLSEGELTVEEFFVSTVLLH